MRENPILWGVVLEVVLGVVMGNFSGERKFKREISGEGTLIHGEVRRCYPVNPRRIHSSLVP